MKWGFVAPTIVFLLAINIYPLIYSIVVSFTDKKLGRPTSEWVGTENYGRVFDTEKHHTYAQAIRTTGIFVFFAVSVELLLGFGLALLLRDRHPFRSKAVVLTILLIPMMLSPVVMGLFFTYILDSSFGILNQILHGLTGIPMADLPQWIKSRNLQLFTILAVDIWMWTPFMMLISMAGLNAIPKYIYEAAEIDRASAWTVFRRITLPMCAPLLMLAALLRTTDALKQFDLVYRIARDLRNEETQTLSAKLFVEMFQNFSLGQGAAYAIVVLVLVIALAVLFTRYLARIQRATGGAA